jgi:hypothetical protein
VKISDDWQNVKRQILEQIPGLPDDRIKQYKTLYYLGAKAFSRMMRKMIMEGSDVSYFAAELEHIDKVLASTPPVKETEEKERPDGKTGLDKKVEIFAAKDLLDPMSLWDSFSKHHIPDDAPEGQYNDMNISYMFGGLAVAVGLRVHFEADETDKIDEYIKSVHGYLAELLETMGVKVVSSFDNDLVLH